MLYIQDKTLQGLQQTNVFPLIGATGTYDNDEWFLWYDKLTKGA